MAFPLGWLGDNRQNRVCRTWLDLSMYHAATNYPTINYAQHYQVKHRQSRYDLGLQLMPRGFQWCLKAYLDVITSTLETVARDRV